MAGDLHRSGRLAGRSDNKQTRESDEAELCCSSLGRSSIFRCGHRRRLGPPASEPQPAAAMSNKASVKRLVWEDE